MDSSCIFQPKSYFLIFEGKKISQKDKFKLTAETIDCKDDKFFVHVRETVSKNTQVFSHLCGRLVHVTRQYLIVLSGGKSVLLLLFLFDFHRDGTLSNAMTLIGARDQNPHSL